MITGCVHPGRPCSTLFHSMLLAIGAEQGPQESRSDKSIYLVVHICSHTYQSFEQRKPSVTPITGWTVLPLNYYGPMAKEWKQVWLYFTNWSSLQSVCNIYHQFEHFI